MDPVGAVIDRVWWFKMWPLLKLVGKATQECRPRLCRCWGEGEEGGDGKRETSWFETIGNEFRLKK